METPKTRRSGIHKKSRFVLGKNRLIFIGLVASIVLGIILGAVRSGLIKNDEFSRLSSNLSVYFSRINSQEYSSSSEFTESLIKYGKFSLIIWFLAFIPPASLACFLILFTKGMSLGFTTGIIFRNLGFRAFYILTSLYLPQNLFLIPGYLIVAYSCLKYAYSSVSANTAIKSKPNPEYIGTGSLSEYFMALLISLTCVALAAFIEVYAIPKFVANIIYGTY